MSLPWIGTELRGIAWSRGALTECATQSLFLDWRLNHRATRSLVFIDKVIGVGQDHNNRRQYRASLNSIGWNFI